MKKSIILALVMLAMILPVSAADMNGKDLGVGLYLGSPAGITAKYDLDDELSIVGVVGFNGGLMLRGGVQYQFLDFSIEKLNFPVYVGGNLDITLLGGFDIGLSIPFGVSHYLKVDKNLVELFLEVGPSFNFVSLTAGATGANGARLELDM